MYDLVTFESFDTEKTYEYILSIQVSLNGFYFSVLSETDNNIIAYKKSSLKISSRLLISRHFEEWCNSEEILKKPFKKIRIIVFSKNFTVVPGQFAGNTLKNAIPEYLFGEKSNSDIAENVVGKLKTHLIFDMPSGLNEVIRNKIGECEIVHPLKIVLNNLPGINNTGVVILTTTDSFYLTIYKNNKLLLANGYKTENAADMIFYITSALKQLEVLPVQTEMFFITTNNSSNNKQELLKKYFPGTKDIKIPELISEPDFQK